MKKKNGKMVQIVTKRRCHEKNKTKILKIKRELNNKYFAKDVEGDEMAKSTKDKRDAHFNKGRAKDDDDPSAYEPWVAISLQRLNHQSIQIR